MLQDGARMKLSQLEEAFHPVDLQHRVYISLRNNYMYFAVPKAANSTIKGLLSQAELGPELAQKLGLNLGMREVHQRLGLPLLFPHQLPEDLRYKVFFDDAIRRFTCVRDPMTRVLSAYLDRYLGAQKSNLHKAIQRKKGDEDECGFEEFVDIVCSIPHQNREAHVRSQYHTLRPDLIHYQDILGFSSIGTALPAILSELYGVSEKELPSVNNFSPRKTGASNRTGEFYSADIERKIREDYALDYNHFGEYF